MATVAKKPWTDNTGLTPADLESFAKLRISPDLLELAGVARVTDQQARERGIQWSGDCTGIIFPYKIDGQYKTCRVRRDFPEITNNKIENKYVCPYGDRRHVYVVPGYEPLLADPKISLLIVEAEKSVLAIHEWSRRTGQLILPVGVGGCYAWSCKVGIKLTPNGSREPEKGLLPELIAWAQDGRGVGILFDSNSTHNEDVQKARAALKRRLEKQKANVVLFDLPVIKDINGPDDYLGVMGDQAFTKLLEGPKQVPDHDALIVNDEGKPKALLANAIIALRKAPEFKGVFAFDEFTPYATTKNPAPWQSTGGQSWSDYDDSRAAEWLQHNGVYVNSKLAGEAVQVLAHENKFHPVKDYLNSITWDRTPRIDHWLAKYLGAEKKRLPASGRSALAGFSSGTHHAAWLSC